MDDIADMPETGAAEPPAIQRKTARAAMIERRRRRKPAPSLKVSRENGAIAVEVDHPDRALGAMELMEALGTADPDFCDGLLSQVVRAGIKGGEPDAREANFLLSVARAAEPRDELEAMLAAQMGAVHMATMTFARRLAHAENLAQQDGAERAFNKLARTFALQLEALKRYRNGGEQRVVVQHVTVNDGGRAIVGAVPGMGGGEDGKRQGQPHAQAARLAHDAPVGAFLPPLRGEDAGGDPLPVASDAQRPMQDARRV